MAFWGGKDDKANSPPHKHWINPGLYIMFAFSVSDDECYEVLCVSEDGLKKIKTNENQLRIHLTRLMLKSCRNLQSGLKWNQCQSRFFILFYVFFVFLQLLHIKASNNLMWMTNINPYTDDCFLIFKRHGGLFML